MSPTDPTPSPLAAIINRLIVLAAPAILGAMATYIATHQPTGVTIDPAIRTALESVNPAPIPAPTDDATRIGRLESRVGGLVAELAQLRAELTAHIHPGRPVTWPNHPGRLGSASPQSSAPAGVAPIGDTGPIGSTSLPTGSP